MRTWNRDMVGIMVALSYKNPKSQITGMTRPHLTTNFIPAALIRLAEEGCVQVGQQVRLTAHGRQVLRIITATLKVAQEG